MPQLVVADRDLAYVELGGQPGLLCPQLLPELSNTVYNNHPAFAEILYKIRIAISVIKTKMEQKLKFDLTFFFFVISCDLQQTFVDKFITITDFRGWSKLQPSPGWLDSRDVEKEAVFLKGKIIITAMETEELADFAGDDMRHCGTSIDMRMRDVTSFDKIAMAEHFLGALKFTKAGFLMLTQLYFGVGPAADAFKKTETVAVPRTKAMIERLEKAEGSP